MAELRRYDLPGTQGSLTVLPGQDPLGATAEERRQSPASQALLRRIDEQQEERAALAKARFEKSKLGLIPAEGGGEKDRRRQYLISQAGKHGVPQNVLAQQMQIEGLEREAPAGPTVKTPYGELPADVGFRYLPEKAKPKAAPTPSEKLYRHPKTKDLMFVNVRAPETVQSARKEGYRPVGKDGKNGTGKGGGGGKKPSAGLYARGEFAIARQMSNKTTGQISDYLDLEGKFNRNLLYKDLDERNTRVYDKASVLKDAYMDEGLNPEAAAEKALAVAEKSEPPTSVKTLDANAASEFLRQAGGNKEAARELAREQGYQF